jgi:predicted enzyme related to lactoylglutathione lyase
MSQAKTTQGRTPTNAINWFEIPVLDFDRAVRFYEAVLSVKLKQEPFGAEQFAVFPASEPGVAGALVKGAGRLPGGTGTLIYIDAPELEESLVKTATAGGKIALPLTDIGPMGHIAAIIDPDGNRIGLHRAPQPV